MAIDTYDAGGDGFRTRLFGFDKSEVRACVRNLVNDHDEARRDVERLTARVRALEGSHEPPASGDSVGLQVEKVLASAHRIAEELKHEAEAAAAKILGDAQDEAVRLRNQAEADAAALASSASARVTELDGEIERMMARRDALQGELNDIATRLDDLSQQMRSFGGRVAGTPPTRDALVVAKV
jgi:cell division septum initiation protein DivIVA